MKWTPYANMFLGIWLIFSPFLLGLEKAPLYNDLACGALLFWLSLLQRQRRSSFPFWAISLLGLWLQCAPLVFWANSACYLNDSLIGIFAALFSIVLSPIPHQMPDEGPSVPPGWSYNPSSWGQRLPIALFALAGWVASRYLAAYQMGHIDWIWDPFFGLGTHNVLTSEVSKAFPVSDAGLGAVAYITEAVLTVQGGVRRWRTSPWMVLLFGVLVVPLSLVSITLIILQPLAVGSWCSVCLFAALCMLFPIAIGIDEVVATLQYLGKSREKPFWELFWKGGRCPGATEDTRSPSPDAPLKTLLKSSLWGASAPWNLVLSAVLGPSLLFFPGAFPLEEIDSVAGPLITVFSVISFSETIRSARYANLALAAVVFGGALLYASDLSLFLHLLVGASVFALAFRKGPIKEKTH